MSCSTKMSKVSDHGIISWTDLVFFLLFVRGDGSVGSNEDGEQGHHQQAAVRDHHAFRSGRDLTTQRDQCFNQNLSFKFLSTPPPPIIELLTY